MVRKQDKNTEKSLEQLARRIVDEAKKLHLTIGGQGFKDEIYRKELSESFRNRDISFVEQPVVKVEYENFQLKGQKSDFLVEEKIYVDVIAGRLLREVEKKMSSNLKYSGKHIGLVLNFGKKEFEFSKILSGK